MGTHISLSELNALVREVISLSMDEAYWVVAEVSELRTAANGHCYMELVEKDATGRGLRAKAAAHVWRNTWPLLRSHFEERTGQRLAAGMKVLVQVEVEFHELYGYSLNVTDIDPTYTLGDMAQRRQEILRQLEEDGVLTLNKELPLPRPLTHIAVVSSASAAGYGDFIRQLEASPYSFCVKLFPAVMQGDGVEQSVISALDAIASSGEDFGCVCILRGGGAVSDLQGFESYALAANVTQFPLPILTGIGHERDDTVIDLVAHTRLKTPTAVAAFLIETCREEVELLQDLEARITTSVTARLQREKERFAQTARRAQLSAVQFSSRGRERLIRLGSRMALASRERIAKEHLRLARLAERAASTTTSRMERERNRLALIEKHLQMASPDRILRLGYSITTINGRIVKNAGDVRPGDILETRLMKGRLTSQVTEKHETS
ncbi:MAG: exodeoxyribonuclease VII large subunit [Alloprevotella sp.]|nr:exodeoxyribonuclease VII large subunit [Alloprevotella sp.]